MTKLSPYALPALIVAILLAAALFIYQDGKRAGERKDALQQIAMRDDSIARYKVSLDSLSRVKRVDSVRFTTVLTKTIALHDTVIRNLHDTVLVKQFIAVQDSTIKACSNLLADCESQQNFLRKQLKATAKERDDYKDMAPTFLMRNEGAVCGTSGAVGVVLGLLIGKHL